MSMPLLKALNKYYNLVELAVIDPTIDVPSELDFIPKPGDDLESMIWALICAILLRHQESLHGPMKARYKLKVVDQFYGSLSYSGLAEKRKITLCSGTNHLDDEPEKWFPDLAQSKWFSQAMTRVAGQVRAPRHGTIKPIMFDSFDALCDEFITD